MPFDARTVVIPARLQRWQLLQCFFDWVCCKRVPVLWPLVFFVDGDPGTCDRDIWHSDTGGFLKRVNHLASLIELGIHAKAPADD